MLARILWHLLARVFEAHKVTPQMIADLNASIEHELAALHAEQAR